MQAAAALRREGRGKQPLLSIMASSVRGSSNLASMRKKRRTIGGFRAHAMGDSFDNINTTAADASNFSLSCVPENLSCLEGESALGGSGSEHIVVAVRVRPLSAKEVQEGKRSCCDVLTRNTLVIRKGADPGAYLRSQKVRRCYSVCGSTYTRTPPALSSLSPLLSPLLHRRELIEANPG